MIAAIINPHVSPFRHMTVDTLRLHAGMTRVRLDIIACWIVALSTKTVIGVFDSAAVRIVTIHAGNAFLIHPALHKGPQNKHLIIDLTISEIEPLF